MQASVVIGANYGDEGKGLITDYLTSLDAASTLVIRFNGGAQAGHTVQRPNGLRHVFSHFASGTFAGGQTYLSDFFIANPILFVDELEKLKALDFFSKVTIHPDAIVTTPYDVMLNQIVENARGKNRHGSCGVGINETVERNLHANFQLTIKDLFDQKKLREKLFSIRNDWVEFRLNQLMPKALTQDDIDLIYSPDLFEYFLDVINNFLNHCDVADYRFFKQWNRLIFEGAQGLLLDQGHKNFPHVTRSHTGLQNVSLIANKNNLHHLDIYYVTRCYLTRHGAGPLPDEYDKCPCPYFKDETNVPHQFQGSLRFAPLNINQLQQEILSDLNKLPEKISKKVALAMTCLDHFDEKIPLSQGNGNMVELEKEAFFNYLFHQTKFAHYIFSCGPTREDLSIHN